MTEQFLLMLAKSVVQKRGGEGRDEQSAQTVFT
jgi:hypothetical protein